MNKKVAMLFFGISDTTNSCIPSNITLHYEESFDNYKKYLFSYFLDLGYDIDTYISSYDSTKKEKIISDYKPVKYIFLKNNLESSLIGRNTHFRNVIKLCLDSSNNYDMVVITRCDLLFQNNFKIYKFNFNLLNIPASANNLLCDNFYILPFNKLELFYRIALNNKQTLYHFMKQKFESNFGNCNYFASKNKKFYKINRKKKINGTINHNISCVVCNMMNQLCR